MNPYGDVLGLLWNGATAQNAANQFVGTWELVIVEQRLAELCLSQGREIALKKGLYSGF